VIDDVRISVEAAEGLARRIRIQVPAAHVERELEARLKSAASTVNLKGFRPGKAPANVIRQRFGDQVRREVVQEFVQNTLADAVAREKLTPVGETRIEVKTEPDTAGADLDFVASFEVLPDIQLQGLNDLAINRLEPAFDDADLDFVLDSLRRQRAAPAGPLPEIDENFIRSFGVASGSRDEFLELIRGYMQQEFEARARSELRRQVLDHLLMRNPVSVPAVLVDHETEVLKAATPAKPPTRAEAEQGVRLAMLANVIIRDQGLRANPARVQERILELADTPADTNSAAVRTQAEKDVLEEQVIDWLAQKAKVTPVVSNFRSLKDRV
jgi:FKBP-type peptidyl-prolyl cis-trans isomerase (trigger factor)